MSAFTAAPGGRMTLTFRTVPLDGIDADGDVACEVIVDEDGRRRHCEHPSAVRVTTICISCCDCGPAFMCGGHYAELRNGMLCCGICGHQPRAWSGYC